MDETKNPDYDSHNPTPNNHERLPTTEQPSGGLDQQHRQENEQATEHPDLRQSAGEDAHTQVDPDGAQVPDSAGTGSRRGR